MGCVQHVEPMQRHTGEDLPLVWDVLVEDGVRDIGYADIPSNYIQIMENSVDPHHVEWMHGYYFEFLANTAGFEAPKAFQRKHVKVAFDEFEYGIIKRRLLEGQDESADDWAVGHPLVFPFPLFPSTISHVYPHLNETGRNVCQRSPERSLCRTGLGTHRTHHD